MDIFNKMGKSENEAKHSFKKGKFFLKGGAITPNAPPQLRHW